MRFDLSSNFCLFVSNLGWIYDQTGSYTLSFVILSGTSLVSVSPQPFVDNKRRANEGDPRYTAIHMNQFSEESPPTSE